MANARVKSPKNRAEDYSYTVAWLNEDDAFVTRVMEFPSLAEHGRNQEKPCGGVVEYVLKDLAANKEPIPDPLSRRNYSGKLHFWFD